MQKRKAVLLGGFFYALERARVVDVAIAKPRSIEESPFRSAKWDEITAGRDFGESDAPALALLCQWYEVVEKCMSDLDFGGGIQVAYTNDIGDIKPLPQLSTMKQASAEIRALNKQLGINDEAKPQSKGLTTLAVITNQRAERRSRAANSA